jgi:hypothetical protein
MHMSLDRLAPRIVCAVAGILVLATCTPAAMPQEAPPLVELHRTGGIAGVDDRVAVYSDDTARVSRRGMEETRVRVSAEEMSRLRSLLAEVDIRMFDSEYEPGSGADYFVYTLTYRGRTLRADDMSLPGELIPIVDLLSGLLKTG